MTAPYSIPRLTAIARGERPADWQFFRAGIEILPLAGEGGDTSAALLRYQPGALAPAHRHTGYEHILVLTGSQRDERARYEAGTFAVNPPGSTHRPVSDDGCVVLIVWERPVEVL